MTWDEFVKEAQKRGGKLIFGNIMFEKRDGYIKTELVFCEDGMVFVTETACQDIVICKNRSLEQLFTIMKGVFDD